MLQGKSSFQSYCIIPKMQTVVDNVLINYHIIGKKQRNTILILHGWGRSLQEWIPIARELSKDNKVVLLDLPGFGGSSFFKKDDAKILDYISLIDNFINKLKLKDIILLGHSFGGKLSVILSVKNKNIKKLILASPSGIEKKNLKVTFSFKIAAFVKKLNFLIPKHLSNFLIGAMSSRDYKTAGELRSTFKNIVKKDVRSEAKNLNIPTIIVWGEKDKELPVYNAQLFRKHILNSTLRIIWGAGHFPHLEKPKQFIQILKEYL